MKYLQSIREMVTKKYEMREEVLKQALKKREEALADHKSGRKLMSDEVSRSLATSSILISYILAADFAIILLSRGRFSKEHARHLKQVKGIHRKLAGIRNKDKALLDLEIESEIERHQRMMEGEFYWTHEGLVLKDP
ncbi:hypothetical protein ACHAXS_009906 [Conticribra weissflogii]